MEKAHIDKKSWIAASIFGVLAALSLWYSISIWIEKKEIEVVPPVENNKLIKIIDARVTSWNDATYERPDQPSDTIAVQYALDIQKGRSTEAVNRIWWMVERLRRDSDKNEIEETKAKLSRTLAERIKGQNILRLEGVEDKYIFCPGAGIELFDVDEGLSDLEKEVESREWLKVRYPNKSVALKDVDGKPIRSLIVGVNVSKDGYILKAGVIGNLDIDWDSISYNWIIK